MADITSSEMMGGSVCKPKPEGDRAFFAGPEIGESSFLNDPLKLELQPVQDRGQLHRGLRAFIMIYIICTFIIISVLVCVTVCMTVGPRPAGGAGTLDFTTAGDDCSIRHDPVGNLTQENERLAFHDLALQGTSLSVSLVSFRPLSEPAEDAGPHILCRPSVRLTRTALSSLCSRVCPLVTVESHILQGVRIPQYKHPDCGTLKLR
ncbi:uncharacterized protein LOC144917248 [Branchiostoma floridae x Branchiostoma belcheri]